MLTDIFVGIPTSIFVLYLILSANFLVNLFSCKAQTTFFNNMWLKHLLGFMTLYFFVVLTDKESKYSNSPKNQMLFAIVCYIVFVLSSRMDHQWWVVFICLLCIIYIIEIYKNHHTTTEEDKVIYNKYQIYLVSVLLVILVIGFIIYLGKKRIEYGKKFDMTTFIVGKTKCRFDKDYDISKKAAIKEAFKYD